MIQLRDNIFAVEVPSMAFGFDLNNYGDEAEYMYMLTVEDIIDEPHHDETLIAKKLPPGTWEIVCTSKDRKIPNGIVECKIVEYDGKVQGTRFVNYLNDNQRRWFINKSDSLRSLLTSKDCDLNKNYLILKKTA
jgi:hypothetical protein